LGCGLDTSCLTCSLSSLLTCTPCAGSFLGLQECFTDCAINTTMLGGDISLCLQDVCNSGYNEMLGCIDPAIATGSCDSGLAACGIALP
ncbi:MAG: hypothetical protein AAFS10_17560, partial [Myxococcota bacterium]